MKMLTLAMPDAQTRSELLVVVALLCAVSNWAWIGTITAASVQAALVAAAAGEGVGLGQSNCQSDRVGSHAGATLRLS